MNKWNKFMVMLLVFLSTICQPWDKEVSEAHTLVVQIAYSPFAPSDEFKLMAFENNELTLLRKVDAEEVFSQYGRNVSWSEGKCLKPLLVAKMPDFEVYYTKTTNEGGEYLYIVTVGETVVKEIELNNLTYVDSTGCYIVKTERRNVRDVDCDIVRYIPSEGREVDFMKDSRRLLKRGEDYAIIDPRDGNRTNRLVRVEDGSTEVVAQIDDIIIWQGLLKNDLVWVSTRSYVGFWGWTGGSFRILNKNFTEITRLDHPVAFVYQPS